jgi:histone H3/H4
VPRAPVARIIQSVAHEMMGGEKFKIGHKFIDGVVRDIEVETDLLVSIATTLSRHRGAVTIADHDVDLAASFIDGGLRRRPDIAPRPEPEPSDASQPASTNDVASGAVPSGA